jgi:hypothetical protein
MKIKNRIPEYGIEECSNWPTTTSSANSLYQTKDYIEFQDESEHTCICSPMKIDHAWSCASVPLSTLIPIHVIKRSHTTCVFQRLKGITWIHLTRWSKVVQMAALWNARSNYNITRTVITDEKYLSKFEIIALPSSPSDCLSGPLRSSYMHLLTNSSINLTLADNIAIPL